MESLPPNPPIDAADDKYNTLLLKFQRDINRMQDSDRNTRRRGLQNLLEELPWTGKGGSGTKKALRQLIGNNILPLVLGLDINFVESNVNFRVLGPGMLADPVEKCRELALQFVKMIFENISGFKSSVICAISHALSARVSEAPFPETAEELRLLVVENLHAALKCASSAHNKAREKSQGQDQEQDLTAISGEGESLSVEESGYKTVLERCVSSLHRAMLDPFPAAKRACGDLAFDLSVLAPTLVRLHFKSLATGLVANCGHQHSKTRCVSLRALGAALSAVKDEFENIMGTLEVEGISMEKAGILSTSAGGSNGNTSSSKKLDLLTLFSKLASDGNASVRKTLAIQLGNVMRIRLSRYIGPVSSSAELQCIVLLLLLLSDEIDEVSTEALNALENCMSTWTGQAPVHSAEKGQDHNANADIVDGEAYLNAPPIPSQCVQIEQNSWAPQRFFNQHATALCHLILRGVNDWTAISQRRYLLGLNNFLLIGGIECALTVLPEVLQALGGPCRDDEAGTREAAELCCARIGCIFSADPSAAISLLVPRVGGDAVGGGGDTASLRARAILELTHILRGLSFAVHMSYKASANTGLPVKQEGYLKCFPLPITVTEIPVPSRNLSCVASIVAALEPMELYEFREPYMREAVLLLVRSIIDSFPQVRSEVKLERVLLLALLYLQGKCSGESDLVPDAAKAQLVRLACPSGLAEEAPESVHANVNALLGRHFEPLLHAILSASRKAQGLAADAAVALIAWPAQSVSKSAFDILIRVAPSEAWKHYDLILQVIVPQVQLPAIPDRETPEAHLESYKAQRGDTDVFADTNNASTRLSLMALLETWVRKGAQDWTCSASLSEAASIILKNIVCGSLVWRVGRVEATVRKVTLAVTHALLRAGAVKPKILYDVAGELVPQITSQMDDNETSVRHISALCLHVIFERLRGAFGYQAVSELYPMLIKRLDDSNDDVRIEACRALGAFMAAASAGAYAGTALDYTLDQLFIHLDDPDPNIQSVVYDVIRVGVTLNKDLVWKKAHENIATHRSTAMCDRLIKELRG